MTTVRSDIDLLKSQLSGLSNELNKARSDLSSAEQRANQTETERDALLVTLQQKEAELATTHTELANILRKSGAEITALREQLTNVTSQASTCLAALGLPGPDQTLPAQFRGGFNMTYCNFTTLRSPFCHFNIDRPTEFSLMHKGHSSYTGPKVDHSLGAPEGTYLGLDAYKVALRSSSSTNLQKFSATSDIFDPATAYCIFFYYSMIGTDVDSLDLNIKIGGGVGYPVWSKSGEQGGWKMGQVELDSEYTANPFQLQFVAKSDAYRYSGSYVRYDKGDIGVDDLYVYNTSCNSVPKCTASSYRRTVNNVTTSCYTFYLQPKSWEQAYETCRKESPFSALVSIESEEEQKYLAGIIAADAALTTAGQRGYYTSGTDKVSEHQFVWTNTGTMRPVNSIYSKWHAGQPNNVAGNQDCLLMEYPSDGYSWGDVDCSSVHSFICESNL